MSPRRNAYFAFALAFGTHSASAQAVYSLSITYDVGTKKELARVTDQEISKRKTQTLTEQDPLESKSRKFTGASLSELVNEKISTLSAAERANLDLVVLKSRSGKEVLMPRAFLQKYNSILVAYKEDGKEIETAQNPKVILPASSNSKIKKEGVILETLFLSGLESITLSSYQSRYGKMVLKRRTDPAAMRGEKLFLQNCAGCHANSTNLKVQALESSGHPKVVGVKSLSDKLDSKQVRSLVSYLEAYKSQSTAQ